MSLIMFSHNSWEANLDDKWNYIISTISDRQDGEVYILFIVFSLEGAAGTQPERFIPTIFLKKNFVTWEKNYISVPL